MSEFSNFMKLAALAGGLYQPNFTAASNVWYKVPSIFRLRLTGTGTITIDARNALGTVTTGVANYTISGATNRIEQVYCPDDTVEVRQTSTGTATAEILGSGGLQKRNMRSNVLSRYPLAHNTAQAGYGGYTSHLQAALAGIPRAVRIGIPNITTGTPSIAGSFGFDTAPGALNSNQSKGSNVTNWNNLTFAGSSSGTHSARISVDRPSWVWSDWIGCEGLSRSDGVDGSIIHVNLIQGSAGQDMTFFNSVWDADATNVETVATHIWRGYRSNAAGNYATTNQGGFPAASGTCVTGHLPCIIQYVSIVPGVTLVPCGDSIYAGSAAAGTLTANGYGWSARARDALSSATRPVEVCNLGWPGQTIDKSYNRLSDIASYLSGSVLMHMAFSANDFSQPATSGNITKMWSYFGLAMSLAQEYNMTPVYQTGTPCNALSADGGSGGVSAKTYTATDNLRVSLNNKLLSSNAYVFDVAATLSGSAVASGAAAGQIEYASALTTDGLHPNDAGYTLWATRLAAYLSGLI